jgi:hypothetical protein
VQHSRPTLADRLEREKTVTTISTDAATLAAVIRDQKALPIPDDEVERQARAIEMSQDDGEFLANSLSAVRAIVDALESDSPENTDLHGLASRKTRRPE